MMVLGLLPAALAQGYEADIELVRPGFSSAGYLGVDAPELAENGTVRWGVLTQYERDPLIAYENEAELGAVVSNRQALQLGVSTDFGDRFSARLVVPFNAQWGSDVQRLAGDGFGVGDVAVGGRLLVGQWRSFDFGARADLHIPTGTNNAYMGEEQPRFQGGFLTALSIPRVTFNVDLSLMGRAEVATEYDFKLAPEMITNVGVVHAVAPGQANLALAMVTRSSLSDAFWAGGAENSSELLTGVQIFPRKDLQLDLGVGKGLADGYGTSEFRGMLGVTLIRKPSEEVPETLYIPQEAPPEVRVTPEPPEEEEWQPDELARVEESRIVIRDPIQFELATARILPESLPTLRAVASIMVDNPEIGHLIIEGHASEEGSYDYNYDLSNLRARSIYQELVKGGVHPKRLSTRGMGEVEPVALGSEEERLAENRRVEFHITHYVDHTDKVPDLTQQIRYPWTGEQATVAEQNKVPEPEPPKPEDILDPTMFEEDDEDQGAEEEE